jgi:hypothetical protein
MWYARAECGLDGEQAQRDLAMAVQAGIPGSSSGPGISQQAAEKVIKAVYRGVERLRGAVSVLDLFEGLRAAGREIPAGLFSDRTRS